MDQADLPVTPPENAHWYVVRTHRGHEARTEANLAAARIEAFCPRTLSYANGGWPGAKTEPLFPQYVFARFDAVTSLRVVCFTRGAQHVISFGGRLASVDDHVIALLRSRIGTDGLVRIGEPLKHGDRVVIEHGPFHGITGILERRMSEVERVTVLLTSINVSMRVEVPTRSVRRAT